MNDTSLNALSRRDLLAGAFGLAASAAFAAYGDGDAWAGGRSGPPRDGREQRKALRHPERAPFDTVVVLMMENRSFDHMLGWLPGADGRQAGLSYVDAAGRSHRTWPLGDDLQGCAYGDPKHSWPDVAVQFDHGRCDGFLKTQAVGDLYPIGYYTRRQLPVLGALARHYTVFDRYFCSVLGATWPNRLYQLSAATDVDDSGIFPGPDRPRPSQLDTAIFDRLWGAGLSAGYYSWGEPMTGLYASKRYDRISYPYQRFFADAAAGDLPNVTFIEPDYTLVPELTGTSNDDHPHGSVGVGEGYIARVYDALRNSPQWGRMVFVLNFDEHGGFYDHVKPPRVHDDNVNPNPGPHPDYSRLGFRVPCIVMGPFAPRRVVHHGPYEHCSILRMIEWRWGLRPMSARDKHARNLAEALDFSIHRRPVALPAFTAPTPQPCAAP